MKKLLIALAVVSVGCKGQSFVEPTVTTSVVSSSSSIPEGPSAGSANDAGASTPSTPTNGRAPKPEYAVQGPVGCVPAGTDPMQWALAMTDAGPSQIRFVALAHQALEPGCEHTVDNPRNRVSVSGVGDYLPHSAGQTLFTFDPRSFTCGRAQIDVSAFDTEGREQLLIGMVVNYGTVCQAPPPPSPPQPPVVPQLQCAPVTQVGSIDQAINLAATGGNGTFAWTAKGETTVAPRNYSTTFGSAGQYTVTVTSGAQSASCLVIVQSTPPPPPPPLVCTPGAQQGGVNQPVRMSATGGTGVYAWSSPTGSPATGPGASYVTSFSTDGSHSVTVTSGAQTAECIVDVVKNPTPEYPELICTPGTNTIVVNAPVTVQANGGTGAYAWSANGGSPVSGNGSSFTTTFAATGFYTIAVTSGDMRNKCNVQVVRPDPSPAVAPVCAPRSQTVIAGQAVRVGATGGNGTFTWAAEGGTSSSGSGASFSTSYDAIGFYSIYVTSNGVTDRCNVAVQRPTSVE